MKQYLVDLTTVVRDKILSTEGTLKNRQLNGYSPGGDAQFDIDEVAEQAVQDFIASRGESVGCYSEDRGLVRKGVAPDHLLIVDPIDGTRPAAAGLEMACISVAVAPYDEGARIRDVTHAILREIKSGAYLYADRAAGELVSVGYAGQVPRLSPNRDLDRLFWSIEFNGHPMQLMTSAYGHLVDRTANRGGIFVFNSASYSISRIITGQLDAYVDIGNRLLKDTPSLLPDFERVGNGHVLHLFPYDIAASVVIAELAGVTITDAYGQSLGATRLVGVGADNQQSCIAASTPEMHAQLIAAIDWARPAAQRGGATHGPRHGEVIR
ncbi:MAG TPA: inositol monophosphatase family protein [Polyangiaceae bacterium]|nr:inositol monophosphatase family protein [Polyangiaceae bacterium]